MVWGQTVKAAGLEQILELVLECGGDLEMFNGWQRFPQGETRDVSIVKAMY